MIKIEQNQIVPENPNLRVLSVSGEYSDNDLIECAPVENPEFALCAFSATFIKYGNLSNQFNDPLLLGEALLKVDPECTHDAATLFKEEELRRIKREGGDFTPENPVPADENISPIAQEELAKEDEIKEEPIEKKEQNTEPVQKETSTETTPIAPLSSNTSTTTTEVASTTPISTSTTTEIILPQSPISTTTPIIEPIIETSSSTPASEIPGPIEVILDSVSNAVTE